MRLYIDYYITSFQNQPWSLKILGTSQQQHPTGSGRIASRKKKKKVEKVDLDLTLSRLQ